MEHPFQLLSNIWSSNKDLNEQAKACCAFHLHPNSLAARFDGALGAVGRKIKSVGMMRALQIARIVHTDDHHRALDDAINIARLLKQIMAGHRNGGPFNP